MEEKREVASQIRPGFGRFQSVIVESAPFAPLPAASLRPRYDMKLLASLLTVAALAVVVFPVAAAEPAAAEAAAAPEATAAPKAVFKPDLAKGEALYGQVCAACHAADGNSSIPTQPKLAQQHPHYLVKQLQDFKAGKRKNAIMQGFASMLSDDDMKNISYWLATKEAKPGFAKDPTLVSHGEQIYRGGVAERGIPACAGCHSPNGAGIPSQYPRLSGQHADYTASQLQQFRAGVRLNSAQMTGVAAKLNDREIKAVSDYIAGLR